MQYLLPKLNSAPKMLEMDQQLQCYLKKSPTRTILLIRWYVAGLSRRRPGLFLHVEILVDKVALGHIFLQVLPWSPPRIIRHFQYSYLIFPQSKLYHHSAIENAII